ALGTALSAADGTTVQNGAQVQFSTLTSLTVPEQFKLNGPGLAVSGPTSGALLNDLGATTLTGSVEFDSDTTLAAAQQVYKITSATEVGSTVTIVTTVPHDIEVGQEVIVAGIAAPPNNAYNGTWVVTSVTASSFTYTSTQS